MLVKYCVCMYIYLPFRLDQVSDDEEGVEDAEGGQTEETGEGGQSVCPVETAVPDLDQVLLDTGVSHELHGQNKKHSSAGNP